MTGLVAYASVGTLNRIDDLSPRVPILPELASSMGNESAEYLPLVSEPPSKEGFGLRRKGFVSRLVSSRDTWLVLVILLQALALVVSLTRPRTVGVTCQCPHRQPSLLYSPADAVLEYQVKVFTVGNEEKTIYQGHSEETERAWGDLYNHTIMKIPKSEAALLPNKTWPIVTEPGYYLASLDVFHQLHCLNHVRRALYNEHHGDDPLLQQEHISHCIDSIRQSLMCNADISVNVWQWDTGLSAVVGHSSQAHSCRNFNKLLDWAQGRQLEDWIDIRLFVEDDLPTPPIISA